MYFFPQGRSHVHTHAHVLRMLKGTSRLPGGIADYVRTYNCLGTIEDFPVITHTLTYPFPHDVGAKVGIN